MKKLISTTLAAVVATIVFIGPAMGQSVAVEKSALDGITMSVKELGQRFGTLETTVRGYGTRLDKVEQSHRVAVAAPASAAASALATGSPSPPPPRVVLASEREASLLPGVVLEVGGIMNYFESSELTAGVTAKHLGRLEELVRVNHCAGTPSSDLVRLCAQVTEAQRLGRLRSDMVRFPIITSSVASVAPPEETIARYAATRCVLPVAIGAVGAGAMAIWAPPNRAAQNEVWVGVGVGAVAGIVSAVLSDGGGKRFQDGLLSAACGFAGAGGVAVGDVAIRPDHRRDIRANVVVVR